MTVHVGREAADRIGAAAELGDDVEHRKVGQVIADEDRMPAGEWWELHQRAHGVALVDRAGLISMTNLPGRISAASCGKPAQIVRTAPSTLGSLAGDCR